ncbi:unnamed protein product [Caenorhabditis auriculariae]|uniref:Intimal thickness related receptor IRP domain-containing protein n=1 Tax=Caenorhabditis auriculariae TaxID=2777116 RepID=A0A8S1H5E9_9PELO|nr:unnamed protein product [Caenorhabditis auriculariae]
MSGQKQQETGDRNEELDVLIGVENGEEEVGDEEVEYAEEAEEDAFVPQFGHRSEPIGIASNEFVEYCPSSDAYRIRTAPCNINRPPPINYPFGVEDDGFYVGSYRDLRKYDLLSEPRSAELLESYSQVYQFFYAKLSEMKENRSDATRKLVILISDDCTSFYFDEETCTLIPENDFIAMYMGARIDPDSEDEDVVEAPIQQSRPILNYENAMPGRHRHSGNQRVHPRNLHTALSRGIRFFPRMNGWGNESGYQSEEDGNDFFPDCTHPHYMKALPFMLARQRALDADVTELEEELRKGCRMDIERVNTILREHYIPRENLPQIDDYEKDERNKARRTCHKVCGCMATGSPQSGAMPHGAATCFAMSPRLLLLLFLVGFGVSKRSQGILSTAKDFVYLDRFCFQSESGVLEYSFKYPTYYPPQMLLLYFDTEDQWPKAYKQLSVSHLPLWLRLAVNVWNYWKIMKKTIRLFVYPLFLWIKLDKEDVRLSKTNFLSLGFIVSEREPSGEVLEDYSNETLGIYTQYTLYMTNGLPDDVLHYQFSSDEWLILPTDTVFLIFDALLMIATCFIGVKLAARRLYHNTFRMCSQSIILDLTGLIFIVISYSIYSLDGVGLPLVKGLGQFIRGLAQMLFVYMCMVLARGLNVTKMRLTTFFDPADVIYQSESLPGILLAVWKVVAWVFFCIGTFTSREASPAKRGFFTRFTFFMTPWFWAAPVVSLIATHLLNSWVRAEVVNIVDNCVVLYGYIVFLWLSRPTDKNQNFPFHIRTTQIDVGIDPHTQYVNEGFGAPYDPGVLNMNAIRPGKRDSEGEEIATTQFE